MPDQSTPLLCADRLTVVLPGDSGPLTVLDGVTLSIGAGEVVDVVGVSGSGKSTLLRTLSRLIPSYSGELSLDGVLASEVSPVRWRTAVALAPQKPALVTGTVLDNLRLAWRFKVRAEQSAPAEQDCREALDSLGLSDVALDRDCSRLSVGQQGRLALARLWLTSPTVLLLDEVDAALDDASALAVSRAARSFVEHSQEGLRRAVVRVRHRPDDGLGTRKLRLAEGRLTEEGSRD